MLKHGNANRRSLLGPPRASGVPIQFHQRTMESDVKSADQLFADIQNIAQLSYFSTSGDLRLNREGNRRLEALDRNRSLTSIIDSVFQFGKIVLDALQEKTPQTYFKNMDEALGVVSSHRPDDLHHRDTHQLTLEVIKEGLVQDAFVPTEEMRLWVQNLGQRLAASVLAMPRSEDPHLQTTHIITIIHMLRTAIVESVKPGNQPRTKSIEIIEGPGVIATETVLASTIFTVIDHLRNELGNEFTDIYDRLEKFALHKIALPKLPVLWREAATAVNLTRGLLLFELRRIAQIQDLLEFVEPEDVSHPIAETSIKSMLPFGELLVSWPASENAQRTLVFAAFNGIAGTLSIGVPCWDSVVSFESIYPFGDANFVDTVGFGVNGNEELTFGPKSAFIIPKIIPEQAKKIKSLLAPDLEPLTHILTNLWNTYPSLMSNLSLLGQVVVSVGRKELIITCHKDQRDAAIEVLKINPISAADFLIRFPQLAGEIISAERTLFVFPKEPVNEGIFQSLTLPALESRRSKLSPMTYAQFLEKLEKFDVVGKFNIVGKHQKKDRARGALFRKTSTGTRRTNTSDIERGPAEVLPEGDVLLTLAQLGIKVEDFIAAQR